MLQKTFQYLRNIRSLLYSLVIKGFKGRLQQGKYMQNDDKHNKPSTKHGPLPKLSRKSKKPRQKFSRENKLLNIVVLLIFAVAVWQITSQNDTEERVTKVAGQFVMPEDLASAIPEEHYDADPRIDVLQHRHEMNVFSQLSARMRPTVAVKTLKEGTGARVFCGQKIRYQLLETDKDAPNPDKQQSLRLGAEVDKVGLSLGIIGMRPGEIRYMEIPTQIWQMNSVMNAPNSGESYAALIMLIAAEEVAPFSEMPLRRFLTDSGAGEELRCGDIAVIDMTIWDSNGTKLFTTEGDRPVYFIPGQGNIPFGIEQAVLGMLPGSTHGFVIPQEMFVPIAPAEADEVTPPIEQIDAQPWPQDLQLPQDRAVIIDATYVNIGTRAQNIEKQKHTLPPE